MPVLVDSHALVWWDADLTRLSAKAHQAISTDADVVISAATVWELAMKQVAGKLPLSGPVRQLVGRYGFRHLPITAEHAERAAALPRHHGDPFDRMLVAQAELESLTLVTADRQLGAYGVPILWA